MYERSCAFIGSHALVEKVIMSSDIDLASRKAHSKVTRAGFWRHNVTPPVDPPCLIELCVPFSMADR
jgi:hypothetical protein